MFLRHTIPLKTVTGVFDWSDVDARDLNSNIVVTSNEPRQLYGFKIKSTDFVRVALIVCM
jgi:hypothetical protein